MYWSLRIICALCVTTKRISSYKISENNDKMKIIFFCFSAKTYLVGAQKNHLTEMFLLGTQT